MLRSDQGAVSVGQFRDKRRDAPGIQNKCVIGQDASVRCVVNAAGDQPTQGRLRHFECTVALRVCQRLKTTVSFALVKVAPVVALELRLAVLNHDLHGSFQPLPDKGRTQRGIANANLMPGQFQAIYVGKTDQFECGLAIERLGAVRRRLDERENRLLKARQRIDVYDVRQEVQVLQWSRNQVRFTQRPVG